MTADRAVRRPRPLAPRSWFLLSALLALLVALASGSARGEGTFFGERERASRDKAARHPHQDDPAGDDDDDERDDRETTACGPQGRVEQLLSQALRGISGQSYAQVRLSGLTTLREEQVFSLLGGPPKGPLGADRVAALIVRLEQSGLFLSVEPLFAFREPPGPAPGALPAGQAAPVAPLVSEVTHASSGSPVGPRTAAEAARDRAAAAPAPAPGTAPPEAAGDGVLWLRLTEHPRVSRVQVSGLTETLQSDLLRRLFDAPSDWEVEHSRRPRSGGHRQDRVDCRLPLPERSWLAVQSGSGLQPGLVWKGLGPALVRVVRWLQDDGYLLASARARLTPDGLLTLEVDEGHLTGVLVRGVSPELASRVAEALELRPGTLFSSGELRHRLQRLEERFPFLEARRRHARPATPEAIQEQAADGTVTVTVVRRASQAEPRERTRRRFTIGWDEDDDWDTGDLERALDFDSWDDGHHLRSWVRSLRRTSFEVDDQGQLVLWMRARLLESQTQWGELLRHTPSTGFAPGLATSLRLWDPQERVNATLDGAFNINTKRTSHDAAPGADLLQRLSAQEKVDWLFGARLSVPSLRVAELGAQLYALTDTSDAWRLTDGESYLYSALINRSDREYYRRSGFTALLTFHLFDRLTLGAELRRDRYDGLVNPRVWSLFRTDEPAAPEAPVTAGQLGSMVLRLEFATDDVALHRVGRARRHTETSLVDHQGFPGPWFATVNTLELGNHDLGSDAGVDFLKVVSDSRLRLEFGERQLLTFRLRAAFGRDLPLQKQEGLGGWNALRGYDFKELRGDGSLLGTVELRRDWFGAFFDLGAVHDAQRGFGDPRPSAGAQWFLGDRARLELAWRLDGKASLTPDARILVGWEL